MTEDNEGNEAASPPKTATETHFAVLLNDEAKPQTVDSFSATVFLLPQPK